MLSTVSAVSAIVVLGGLATAAPVHPIQLETRVALDSRLANVHVSFANDIQGVVSFAYGACHDEHIGASHHIIGRGEQSGIDRLVWRVPDDVPSDGCISAWSENGTLLGRSQPQSLHTKRSKRSMNDNGIVMDAASGIDAWGPWFDGVALLQDKNISVIDEKKAKAKHVTIVGAGMSGLMTYLVLTQAGMTNVHIVEAGQRLGGRVHTEYLSGGPFDYSYQEMGPMRFPKEYTSSANETYNITDHQLVFQLASEMNTINKHNKNLSVDFIPWYQSNTNGLYYHNGIKLANGLPPTQAQVAANSSLKITTVDDASTTALNDKIESIADNEQLLIDVAQNMFKAHAAFLKNGTGGLPGDQWSEFAYMVNYLKASLNDTDIVSGGDYGSSLWDSIYDNLYFGAAKWLTIDGGLNRLPLSFHPIVDKATTLNTRVERVQFDKKTEKVSLQWRHNYTDSEFHSISTDYAIIAVPFSVVRRWRFSTGALPTTITNAITHLPYGIACKVALEFKTRFWEHFENPIYGSCSTSTDIPGVGSVCYPSYNINGSGPATMLGSYISGTGWADYWAGRTDEEHMQYILDAMIEIHGDVAREQFTGKYNRRCWNLDPYESASWASPNIGQHQLYLPEYFKTHSNMIFVGEHTSYTHAWIASALESGIRGSVQLLLELGLVDEAKAAVAKWMARWIDI